MVAMGLRTLLPLLALVLGSGFGAKPALALIHTAPIVITGNQIKPATHYPIGMYRLFRTDEATGKPIPIPFQIDEINEWGDYVLPLGGDITAHTGNGIFDLRDELAFMGDDVGVARTPTNWSEIARPTLLFEIRMSFRPGRNPAGDDAGAVYLAIYFQSAPPLSERSYVNFSREQAEILTSRYRYSFEPANWLVSRRVDMLKRPASPGAAPTPGDFVTLLDSTTFYLRADLKYFLTVEASHRSVDSKIEAYATGPVRSIIRISFHYTFLKLNFELGMYTEISFFSNAVYLPAIIYNPIDGRKALNPGSGFYYGMALRENPEHYRLETNMPPYHKSGLLDFLKAKPQVESLYWVNATAPDRLIYMEISPSKEMRNNGAVPMVYQEPIAGPAILDRQKDKPGELGHSPVNLALFFDMTRLTEGEHVMAFRLFFENVNDDRRLAAFKNLGNWDVTAQRLQQGG